MNALRSPKIAPFLVALGAACVPTEPERDVRGGLSVTLLPSEATAGVPFQTNDGWTVTIEKTALRVGATALAQDPEHQGFGNGGHAHVIDPRYACELRATGLPPGPALVYVSLQSAYNGYEKIDDSEVCAVDEGTVRRFKTYADDAEVEPGDVTDGFPGPSFYVKGTAAKNGRVLSFDWALAIATTPPDFGTYDENGMWKPTPHAGDNAVNVVANQGTPVRFEAHVESFFAGGIDSIAAADANGDGVVTIAELRQIETACTSYGSSSSGPTGAKTRIPRSSSADDDDFSDDSGPAYPTGPCHELVERLLHQGTTILSTVPKK